MLLCNELMSFSARNILPFISNAADILQQLITQILYTQILYTNNYYYYY